MIEEDLSDSCDLSQTLTEDEEEIAAVHRANQECQRRYSQVAPQINITDAHGQVMAVPPANVEGLDNNSEDAATVDNNLVHFINNGQFFSSAVPVSQRYPAPLRNLEVEIGNEPVPQEEEIIESSPNSPKPTMNATLPMMGIFQTGLGMTPPVGSPTHRHRFHNMFTNNVDNIAQPNNDIPSPVQTIDFSSFFMPGHVPVTQSTSNPDVNTINKQNGEMNLSQQFTKLRAPGEVQSPTLEGINAMNWKNSLSDMPQGLKFALSVNLTSTKQTEDIMKEIKRALDEKRTDVVYRHSNNLFHLDCSEVQMEMEVCEGTSVNGLRFRKIAGDTWQYKRLCNELISCMNL
jgi:hypothetical protein